MMNVFDRHYRRYDAWYDKNRFVYLSELKTIREVLPKKGRGLEIGVGSGRFAAPLGIKCGIDPSKNMLKMAKERGVDARPGVGEALPFRNAAFDYVAIIITFCFVRDPVRVLRESRRVLKRNGTIILGIVDKSSFLGRSYRKKKSVFYRQAHFFDVAQVTGLLEEAGFSGFVCYQNLFKPPDRMRAVQRPRSGFGRGGFVVISGRKK